MVYLIHLFCHSWPSILAIQTRELLNKMNELIHKNKSVTAK